MFLKRLLIAGFVYLCSESQPFAYAGMIIIPFPDNFTCNQDTAGNTNCTATCGEAHGTFYVDRRPSEFSIYGQPAADGVKTSLSYCPLGQNENVGHCNYTPNGIGEDLPITGILWLCRGDDKFCWPKTEPTFVTISCP